MNERALLAHKGNRVRMSLPFKNIVLTGASSGIGEALAIELAARQTNLLLIGRNSDRLAGAAEKVARNGGRAATVAMDISDHAALSATLLDFDSRSPVDLVVANAGISAGLAPGYQPEGLASAARIVETNLLGCLATVEPLLPRMLERGHGHIALISSMAALHPHCDMPSYSASKAGVRAWGISLRRWLEPRGIAVSIVCPGFVTSPMSARHHGPKPFEIGADAAARRIVRGLRRREAMIAFPWQLLLLTRLGNLLPPRIGDFFARRFSAVIQPGQD